MTFRLPSPRDLTTTRRLAGAGLAALALLGVAGATPAAAASPDQTIDITFPTDPGTSYSNDYHAPRGGGSRTHCSTDVLGKKHQKIYAARGGTITSIPMTKPSYGYAINIAGDDGRRYTYIHLNDDNPGRNDDAAGPQHAYAAGLQRGSKVARGQHIGYMGDSGNAKGGPVHLHFEIHDPSVNNPICTNGGGADRMNPYHSLRAAAARGDYGGRVAPAPAPVRQARTIDQACPQSRVQSDRFDDVSGTHTRSVNCVAWWDIAYGTSEGVFTPGQAVTREQLATFLVRMLDSVGRPLPLGSRDHFSDDNGSIHQGNINRVAEVSLVNGVGGDRFDPSGQVTRSQMAAMISRAYAYASGRELPTGSDAFRDDNGHPHEANINRLAEARITAGATDGRFHPTASLTRGQMAAFLARTLDLLVAQGRTSLPR